VLETSGDVAELVEGHLVADPREADEAGEAHRDVAGSRKSSGLALGLADDLALRDCPQLQAHHLAQKRLGRWHQPSAALANVSASSSSARPGRSANFIAIFRIASATIEITFRGVTAVAPGTRTLS
jgi:hypothetical protein